MTNFWKSGRLAWMLGAAVIVSAAPLPLARAEESAKTGIFGRVTLADGTAVSGVEFRLGDSTALSSRTNSGGHYTIGNLSAGTYVVHPNKAGFSFAPPFRSVGLPTSGKPTSPYGEANFRAIKRAELTISGLILTSEGKPLPNATVSLSGSGFETRSGHTNGYGIYHFDKLPYGRYYATPSREGFTFAPTARSVMIPTAGGEFSPGGRLNFVAKPVVATQKVKIYGRVTDATGAPLSGVGLFLGDATSASATSNSEGKYVILDLAAGRYVVKARQGDAQFEPSSRIVELPTKTDPPINYTEANFQRKAVVVSSYVVRGRVTSASGAGVAGVGIFVGDSSDAKATTNSEGRYEISGLAAGHYVVGARKEGATFDPAYRTIDLPTQNQTVSPNAEANFTLKAPPPPTTYAIRVHVVNSSGAGVAGVSVLVGDYVTSLQTNSEGVVYLQNLKADSYVISVRQEGATFEPATRAIALPATGDGAPNAQALFTLQTPQPPTTYAIRGRVTTSSGVAIAGVEIRTGDAVSAITNSEGHYAIEGLEAGNYTLAARKTGFGFTPSSRVVALPRTEGTTAPDGEASFVGAEVATTYSISGTVKDSAGAPVAGVTITLGDSDHVVATTNSEGVYTISGLASGSYGVHPHLADTTFNPVAASAVLPTTSGDGAPNARVNFITNNSGAQS